MYKEKYGEWEVQQITPILTFPDLIWCIFWPLEAYFGLIGTQFNMFGAIFGRFPSF